MPAQCFCICRQIIFKIKYISIKKHNLPKSTYYGSRNAAVLGKVMRKICDRLDKLKVIIRIGFRVEVQLDIG